jgi:hypothetical protein
LGIWCEARHRNQLSVAMFSQRGINFSLGHQTSKI